MLSAALVVLLLQQTNESQQQPDSREVRLTPEAHTFIENLALLAVPHEYSDDDKWDLTKPVQSGLSVRFENGQVRTKRKWKRVRHGRWQKYSVRLVDPDRRLSLRISNVRKKPEGPFRFQVDCLARLRTEARFQDWQLGIQVFRTSAESVADVRVLADCELGVELDHATFPPAVQLRPVVHDVKVRIGKFEVRRISHLKGSLADQFSSLTRAVLARELRRRERDLPKKINKQIGRQEDDLRLSLGQWLEFSAEQPVTTGGDNGDKSGEKRCR